MACPFPRCFLDDFVPTYVLIRALRDKGWKFGPRPIENWGKSPKLFGEKTSDMVKSRAYLHCLVNIDVLKKRGLKRLSSLQCSKYYRVILKAAKPADIPLDDDSAAYDVIVKTLAILDDVPRTLTALMDIDAESDEGDLSLQDQENLERGALTVASVENPRVTHPLSMQRHALGDISNNASDNIGNASVEEAATVPRVFETHHKLNGCAVCIETHLTPGEKGYYSRYTVACNYPGHWCMLRGGCRKRRNMGAAQTRLGPMEPIAYLGVWLGKACNALDRANHVHCRLDPSKEEVIAYMLAKAWDCNAQ